MESNEEPISNYMKPFVFALEKYSQSMTETSLLEVNQYLEVGCFVICIDVHKLCIDLFCFITCCWKMYT